VLNLHRGTSKSNIARAILEVIALQSNDLYKAMQSDLDFDLITLRVDGGACLNDLLMQYQADITGVGIERPKVNETTALGAAYLAGLKSGYWKSLDEIKKNWQLDRHFIPNIENESVQQLKKDWAEMMEVYL
jgi:glycerol kinase